MNIEETSEQLLTLAAQLREHHRNIDADALEKPLATFQKALAKFEETLSDLLKKKKASREIKPLSDKLNSPAGRVLLKEDTFVAYSKTVIGKKFIKKGESSAKALQRFVEHVAENRLVPSAVKAFDALIESLNRPPFDSDSEIELLREIRHMGSLSDDALELAFATRYNDEKLLRKMAAAAHIKITAKTKVAGIAKKLIPYARNAHANTSF